MTSDKQAERTVKFVMFLRSPRVQRFLKLLGYALAILCFAILLRDFVDKRIEAALAKENFKNICMPIEDMK